MDEINLETIDIVIISSYFVMIIVVGLVLSRLASRSINDYFLGGRRIPWWILGVSGSASNFDMTGTMLITSFFFAIGFQGFWVATRGGLNLGLCVLLAFMAKWLRRSRVMTTAEWMELRFGKGRGGQTARVLSAVANIVLVVGMVIYFAKGTGKFIHTFVPFLSPELCSLVMIAIALAYTVTAGLYGVVFTDLFQEVLILLVAGYIVFKAAFLPDHAQVLASAGAQWVELSPQWVAEPMLWLTNPHVYQSFGICILFWVFKAMLDGAGGGSGGYGSQRFYAAADERSASLMTVEWTMLLSIRFAMVAGIALLGMWLVQNDQSAASILHADAEETLPLVFARVLPVGLKGLALAGLMAAAMSTFDSTVNAGAAYWVRDIYQRFWRPRATEVDLVRQSHLATLAIAIWGALLALAIENINEIWDLLTGSLGAAFLAPLAFRWYWWRFNGYGFAASTGVGLTTAILLKLAAPELAFYESTGITLAVSVIAAIVVTFATPPVDCDDLRRFYKQIRPFGLWGPLSGELDEDKRKHLRLETTIDCLNVFVALGWQVCMFIAAITAVWHRWTAMYLACSGAVMLGLVLYFSWYRGLPPRQVVEEEPRKHE